MQAALDGNSIVIRQEIPRLRCLVALVKHELDTANNGFPRFCFIMGTAVLRETRIRNPMKKKGPRLASVKGSNTTDAKLHHDRSVFGSRPYLTRYEGTQKTPS